MTDFGEITKISAKIDSYSAEQISCSLFLLGQFLARLEAPEAGLNLGGRLGGNLLSLPHQEPTNSGLDLGGRLVLQTRGQLFAARLRSGRSCLTTSRSTAARATGSRRLLVPNRLPHPVTAEAGLDLGGRVLLRGVRRGGIRRGRMDVHLVQYRPETVHERVQRNGAAVLQRGDSSGARSGNTPETRFRTKN